MNSSSKQFKGVDKRRYILERMIDLDNRSEKILNYLIYDTQVDNQTLMNEFSISRNQLNYSIKKINAWCADNRLPEIKRLRNGHFYLSASMVTSLRKEDDDTKILEELPIYAENIRGDIMLLIIATKLEYLSLSHFMIDLEISKNTAVRTLKEIRKSLSEDVSLSYSRNKGYRLIGNEWTIRKRIIQTIIVLKKLPNSDSMLVKFSSVDPEEIQVFRKILDNAETTLQVNFSDERMEILPYILAIISRRISKGYVIQESFQINNSMLADTKEYVVASQMFEKWNEIPDQEKLFITLQLLTTNIISGDLLTEELSKKLIVIIDDCLKTFERLACVTLEKKEGLRDRMLLHLKPAFYRIKYCLHLNMKPDDLETDDNHHAFKKIIREAFQPLETFIGEKIPDDEYTFLAIFILGALSNAKKNVGTYRAIVVCKSGVLISQTLNAFLQKIFPEFQFLAPCSLRSFQEIHEKIDIVFSTVPIKGVDRLYLVKPVMSHRELENLKNQVFSESSKDIYQREKNASIETIMKIIETHTEIKEKKALVSELTHFFQSQKRTPLFSKELPNELELMDLLKQENIQIVSHIPDYEAAIRLASMPLLNSKSITQCYVDKMINDYDFDDSYVILGNDIAIPHAKPEDGVNSVGISLLYIQEGVAFSEGRNIHFIFIIAPVDQKKHLQALYAIMDIAESPLLVELLKKSYNPNELYERIKHSIEKETN